MQSKDTTDNMLQVWCPLIPANNLVKLSQYIVELERVNDRYDDWRASMRTKKIVNIHIGVVLDRIRILLMGIGIACASNRGLADTLQGVISDCLRKSCLASLENVRSGKDPSVVATTEQFLKTVRFTRDIYPEEEIERAYKQSGSEGEMTTVTAGTLDLAATIVKAVYLRLLSPDPWQYMGETC
jgi:hypothetical protein